MRPNGSGEWDRRIERARELAVRHPASAEVLEFYRQIAEFQKQSVSEIDIAKLPPAANGLGLRARIDFEQVARCMPTAFAFVARTGPSRLKEAAQALEGLSKEELVELLREYVGRTEDTDAPAGFFARICLQPHAELLASQCKLPHGFAGAMCPLCGGRPQLAVLRPEGEGGKRFLLCSFCMTEWEFRRVLCPVCAEVDYQKLPRYKADELSAVRVDACDTCKFYLKSIDLTVDGRAVPLVDEIATAPLDLWAAEGGYKKIFRNIVGL